MTHIKNREKITEMDLRMPDYSFDLLGLWRDSDGGFYLGTDSGCSWPTPWESHTEDDLTGPLTLDQVMQEAVDLWKNAGKYGEIKGFMQAAMESFLTNADTRWTITDYYDLYETEVQQAGITDANGVEWHYNDDYEWEDAKGNTPGTREIPIPAFVKEDD
jgi:hypothetical protein